MNEPSPTTPTSIWNRPWRGSAKVLAWFILLVAACFLVLCLGALLTGTSAWGEQWLLVAFISSVALVGVGTAGLALLRWLCCWKNFRRFLFGVACLITLVALFYAVEDWRGKRAWQNYRQPWETKGEKFDLASLAPPQVPDDKNFAMTPLLKSAFGFSRGPTGTVWRDTNAMARLEKISAEDSMHRGTNDHLGLGSLEKGTFADLGACAEFYRDNTNYPQAPPTAPPADIILTALGKFDPELKELREAAATRPSCRFAVQYAFEPPWDILLPHLARVKGLTQLTHVRAIAELQAGRAADAFEDLKLGLRLSDCIRDEPFLIDHLVRVATLGINLQTVREGLVRHAWTEAQLAQIEAHLSSLDVLAEYKHAMRGERACTTEGLDYLRRQGFRSNPMNYIGNEDGGASDFSLPFNPMPSGWFYQNMLTMAQIHQRFTLPTVDEQAHRISPDLSENGARAVTKMRAGPYTIFAKMLMPALERAVRKSARMQVFVDATCVACAIERYRLANGKLPEKLDALAPAFIPKIPNDVIDGKPLRYQLKSDSSYVLYSVGWNQTDDGGEIAWSKKDKEPSIDVTKGDWVWQLAAK